MSEPRWPDSMPEQITFVRDLVLTKRTGWTAETVARSFKYRRAGSAESGARPLRRAGPGRALQEERPAHVEGGGEDVTNSQMDWMGMGMGLAAGFVGGFGIGRSAQMT
ncbi:MAG: hypothetical protein M0R80_22325 [Proteobacteria bacterium]|jgi:hypothetical protein|nr:hypothetical protein [Pseudomonadota bacterium]